MKLHHKIIVTVILFPIAFFVDLLFNSLKSIDDAYVFIKREVWGA